MKSTSRRSACALRGQRTPVRAASADTDKKSKRRSTMKKIIATAAIAACSSFALSGAAQAQSSVAVYGLLDAAVDYNTNVDSAGHSRVWMPSLGGGMFPSRLGFKGSEDLGHGLKAIFTLEAGIYVDSGTSGQGNRLFGRQAWVGLAGNWGS
jgi:predicted porin